MFAIITPTFKRNDGKTQQWIKSTIRSVYEQTYGHFMMYIIGDAYSDEKEFSDIFQFAKDLLGERIKKYNLDSSPERERYGSTHPNMWNVGGITATNVGIDMALSDGYEWVCYLDHDDIWDERHLNLIHKKIENNKNLSLVGTLGKHITGEILPRDIKRSVYYPIPEGCLRSSICVNHVDIPLRFRDCLSHGLQPKPSDADMWLRMSKYMSENNLFGDIVNVVTVDHFHEKNKIR